MTRIKACCEAVLKYRMQHLSGDNVLESEQAFNTWTVKTARWSSWALRRAALRIIARRLKSALSLISGELKRNG